MNNNNNNNNYTSFSSSLLEEIYRSFDDDKDRRSKMAKFSKSCNGFSDNNTSIYMVNNMTRENRTHMSSRDRYVLQQWMDKEKEKEKEKENDAVKLRRNSLPEEVNFRRPLNYSSSTSSSDSSSGIGGFSSSDTESLNRAPTRLKAKIPSLKPIRTATSSPEFRRKSYSADEIPANKKSKKEGKLQQRALKLYGDLKKVKQPISPGGKLASFLNSLFHSGNSRKPKIEESRPSTSPSPAAVTSSTVPSTASSYSRSCLSKTPSSAGRFERRSVRFCPVNVVVDEAGQKSVYNDGVSRMDVCGGGGGGEDELKVQIREKQRRVEEAAKELLKNYRSNNQIRKEFKVNVVSANHGNFIGGKSNNKLDYSGSKINLRGFEDEDEDEEEEEDDDGESCCSSDLFELDNLLEIGVDDRYRQELPVYETTRVSTNRAIANGFIL